MMLEGCYNFIRHAHSDFRLYQVFLVFKYYPNEINVIIFNTRHLVSVKCLLRIGNLIYTFTYTFFYFMYYVKHSPTQLLFHNHFSSLLSLL